MKTLFLLSFLMVTTIGFSQSLDSLEYQVDGQTFMAFYAKPPKITKKTKTILIIHEWWGLNDYPKTRALKIAQEGNIAVCIDMYGKGNISNNPKGAKALATPFYQDPELAYKRFMNGYNEAIKIDGVDKSKIAVIGYCFGGSMALNAAKMGAPVDAVVSFHGGLAGIPVDKNKLKAAILVCNGAADSFVPQKDIQEIKTQMKNNGADFTFINYANATHAFTNPQSTAVGKKFNIPISYNEKADAQSWQDFNKFLKKKVK